MSEKALDEVTGHIVDASYKLYNGLGPGLPESVYEGALERDLERRGLKVERRKLISFEHEGLRFSEGLGIDLLVESQVVAEVNSIERLSAAHSKQLLTCLRLMSPRLRVNEAAHTEGEGS
jgi:GxxExxY protein